MNDIKKRASFFQCEKCDYKTTKNSNYYRHIHSLKHKQSKNGWLKNEPKDISDDIKNEPACIQCHCGKVYQYSSGLWRHKQNCTYDKTNNININKISHDLSTHQLASLTNAVLEVVKQSNDFKELIIEQHSQILELTKSQQQVTMINNNTANIQNTQINKQKFNLNFFLNETCKDAMNITDFVNSLQIQFSDLEKVGELGYAEGISRIFMRGLKALDVCKRPVHCTDLKREIVHIKNNNKWEKEISLLLKAIKIITNNNINKITEWKNAHPGCTDGENKLNDKYCKILYESMGPIDEKQEQKDFSKIIKNIAKCTVVDKAA